MVDNLLGVFLCGEDFMENQQKQPNSYIQRLKKCTKERRKKIEKLTTYRI